MVRKAIKIAGNTMPGPDQIPYKAWKRLGELAVTTLHDAILELSSSNALEALCTAYEIEGDVASHSFNKSTLCCLPKKKQERMATWEIIMKQAPRALFALSTRTIDS